MHRIFKQERDAIYKHLDDFDFEFVVPLAVVEFYWDDLSEGCMGSFYRPNIVKLPMWYHVTATSPKGVEFATDMVDLLPTIGHEVFHMKQFIDNPALYMFAKNRLVARWTIEKRAVAEGKRIRKIIGREEHNQEGLA